VLTQGEDIVPIPGTKRLKYLEDNLGALQVTLSAADDAEIRQKLDAIPITGERYQPKMMSLVNG
jgi:aryl-alcohol dehydrogenase-like predicted oxidoreductase